MCAEQTRAIAIFYLHGGSAFYRVRPTGNAAKWEIVPCRFGCLFYRFVIAGACDSNCRSHADNRPVICWTWCINWKIKVIILAVFVASVPVIVKLSTFLSIWFTWFITAFGAGLLLVADSSAGGQSRDAGFGGSRGGNSWICTGSRDWGDIGNWFTRRKGVNSGIVIVGCGFAVTALTGGIPAVGCIAAATDIAVSVWTAGYTLAFSCFFRKDRTILIAGTITSRYGCVCIRVIITLTPKTTYSPFPLLKGSFEDVLAKG